MKNRFRSHPVRSILCCFAVLIVLISVVSTRFGTHPSLPGIDLPDHKVLLDYDDHGGFLGDGLALTILQFDDDSFPVIAAEENGWRGFPIQEEHRQLATLFQEKAAEFQPFLEKASSGTPADGLYLFYDRFSEAADPYDAKAALDRFAYNFTLAIYDRESRQLAIYTLDT